MPIVTRIAITVGVVVFAIAINFTPLFNRIDLTTFDYLNRLRGKTQHPSNVMVIAIDEPSYRELGVGFTQPWPRALHAKLLRRLKELGVKRVAFDVLFTGPGADPAVDQELIEAFKGVNAIIGVEANKKTISKPGGSFEIEELDQPYDEFRKVTRQALVNLNMNTKDGFIRTFPFPNSDQTKKYPFLAYAAAGVPENPGMQTPRPSDMLKYYGSSRENARILSYWEMFEEMAPSEEATFKDAIVFVGLLLRSDTGVAQKDSYLSPFGGDMIYGVEVHAVIAGNLQEQSWISRPGRAVELAVQSILAGATAFIALTFSPTIGAIVVVGTVIAWLITAFVLLGQGVFLAGAATVLLLLPTILLVQAFGSYLSSRKKEEALRSAFSLYVSPDMVPKLQEEGGALKLGGEKMWITAMFTDIADFTSISEEMPAEQTSEMLNAYFTEVMDVVFANQGTLLKFIGDAIFAIWGAPIKMQNHAEMSIKTALAIQKGVEEFNKSKRFPPLLTRVGVHTGPMLVGNLGSKKRFDYTAIGDSVNLASRIEGLNKYFGTVILFTEATRKDAGGVPEAIQIATVRVKGRKEPVVLLTLFDPPLKQALREDWNEAVRLFARTRFDEAETLFKKIEIEEPRLAVAATLYVEHIVDFRTTPPPRGWDGEIDFTVK